MIFVIKEKDWWHHCRRF